MGDIEDKTNLMTAVRTNSGYAGIEHPMVRVGHGQFVPDFQHRFLAEDLPFGLAVHRGIAELADVPTPAIDRVLSWGQDRLAEGVPDHGRPGWLRPCPDENAATLRAHARRCPRRSRRLRRVRSGGTWAARSSPGDLSEHLDGRSDQGSEPVAADIAVSQDGYPPFSPS